MTTISPVAGFSGAGGTAGPPRSGGGCAGGGDCRGLAVLLDETRDGIADFRTLALPVGHPAQVETQVFPAFRRLRVIEAHAFDEAPIARVARIRHHHVVERTPLGAAASQSDHYHVFDPRAPPGPDPIFSRPSCRIWRSPRF